MAKLRLTNDHDRPLGLWVEPLGEDYWLSPKETFTIIVEDTPEAEGVGPSSARSARYDLPVDSDQPLMHEVYPDLSAMLVALLNEEGEGDLAARALDLRIVARCGCGDDFCQSFYTAPKPAGAYGPGHRNVMLSPPQGEIVLDVVCDEIMFVELLSLPPLESSPVSTRL